MMLVRKAVCAKHTASTVLRKPRLPRTRPSSANRPGDTIRSIVASHSGILLFPPHDAMRQQHLLILPLLRVSCPLHSTLSSLLSICIRRASTRIVGVRLEVDVPLDYCTH
jgi:hypothetical protein